MLVCPRCGGKTVISRTRQSRVVAGMAFAVDVVARICKGCRESFVPGELLERVELTIAADLATNGPVNGETFRFMRKALGIAAMRLAVLLDVAAETLSRWERGQRDVDRNAWLTVGTIVLEQVKRPTRTLARLSSTRSRDGAAAKRPKAIRLVLVKSIARSD